MPSDFHSGLCRLNSGFQDPTWLVWVGHVSRSGTPHDHSDTDSLRRQWAQGSREKWKWGMLLSVKGPKGQKTSHWGGDGYTQERNIQAKEKYRKNSKEQEWKDIIRPISKHPFLKYPNPWPVNPQEPICQANGVLNHCSYLHCPPQQSSSF